MDVSEAAALRWAPSTREAIARSYGRWLGWLERSGELNSELVPGARVTSERLSRYLQALAEQGLTRFSISMRLQQLGQALRALEPGSDWAWISKASFRIKPRQCGSRLAKYLSRSPEEIERLGLDLMHAAELDRFRSSLDRALLFRDGLILALLVHRPLRLGNMVSIEVGRHLIRRTNGWLLEFDDWEMKARRPFSCPWPSGLDQALDRYLDAHRAVLLGRRSGPELWLVKDGRPMTSHCMRMTICKRTVDEFGAPINPHTFRHIAATAIASENPEGVTGIATVLGHATLEPSERHYNGAKMTSAGTRYQAILRRMKKKARSTGRGRGASTI